MMPPRAAECPAWFTNAEARREWWNLAPHVHRLVGLTPRNAERLARCLEAHFACRRLNAHLQKHGSTRMTRRGPVLRPEWRQYSKASRTFLHHASALGLTPMGRARILARRAKRERDD
jgi:P27 family predicted phage terminase small subunit